MLNLNLIITIIGIILLKYLHKITHGHFSVIRPTYSHRLETSILDLKCKHFQFCFLIQNLNISRQPCILCFHWWCSLISRSTYSSIIKNIMGRAFPHNYNCYMMFTHISFKQIFSSIIKNVMKNIMVKASPTQLLYGIRLTTIHMRKELIWNW